MDIQRTKREQFEDFEVGRGICGPATDGEDGIIAGDMSHYVCGGKESQKSVKDQAT